MVTLTNLLIAVAVFIVVYVLFFRGSEGYRFLGGEYSAAQGGTHAEPNEDCLQFPNGASRKCILTDGTSGTCVQNGLCVADMLIDLNLENLELKKPYCTEPTFKENCNMFARCKSAQNGDVSEKAYNANLKECLSWFSPL